MHVDDLADGVLFLLRLENPPNWVNLGTGMDHSILEIAKLVRETVGFDGRITHDLNKPDGMLVKRLDTSLIKSIGWEAMIPFEVGLKSTYEDFLKGLERGTNRI